MLKRISGFTMVELMISLSAMALVVVYSMGTFTVQNDTATVIGQLSEAQQNMLAAASLLERDARNAGYLMPAGGAACALDQNVLPDTLFFADADAIRNVDDLPVASQGTRLGISVAIGPTVTGAATYSVSQTILDEQATYRRATGSLAPDSDFRFGGGVIVVDAQNPSRGAACGTVILVTDVLISANYLTALAPAVGATDVRMLPAHVYSIDSAATPPVLMRNGIPLASDVEDLQAAFFFDADDDGVVDANEYKGDSLGNSLSMSAVDGTTLREIRFNLVVATSGDDPRKTTTAGRGQITENRHEATVSDVDGRHRRVYTSTIRFRNVSS